MKATNVNKATTQSTRRPIVIRGQRVRKSPTIKSKGCGCSWRSYSN